MSDNVEVVRRGVEALGRWDVEALPPDCDAVLAIGNTTLRGKGSGVELRFGWGQIFRFRNGKVWWSKIYSDPAEARTRYEALGADA